jgi:hypothetical protein
MPRKMPIIRIRNIPSFPPLSSKLEFFSKLNAFYNFWSLEQWSLYKILLFVFHFIHSYIIQKFWTPLSHSYEVQFYRKLMLWIQHYVFFTSIVWISTWRKKSCLQTLRRLYGLTSFPSYSYRNYFLRKSR